MKRLLAFVGAFQFLAALHAEERCPVEVKLLLPPSTTRAVIASLGFGKETRTRVFLFDTDALDLLTQGVIIRLRTGVKSDLTVKVRLPKEKRKIASSPSSGQFPCEIDRTRSAASISFAVARKYEAITVPANGKGLYKLLNTAQIRLLHEAGVSIEWARVRRIASIKSTKWETTTRSPSGGLTLELWEWSAGQVLEVSTKVESEAEASKLADLERLLEVNNLSLSASQDTKTNTVLETVAHHTSRPR